MDARSSGIRYVAGTIRVPRLAFGMLGGRVSASGDIAVRDARETRWLDSPVVDVAVRAAGLSIEKLLGATFAKGQTTFRARVRGAVRSLNVALDLPAHQSLTVLGERFGLPSRLVLRFTDESVSFDHVGLSGPGASLIEASGRVALTGRPRPRRRRARLPHRSPAGAVADRAAHRRARLRRARAHGRCRARRPSRAPRARRR